ncbi:gliding motility protein GldN [Tunicatimonas pelagia]|uniref:type IX secretion system ring protein PorN/GldN n=1 Tax=Tunicatimonas pelagia TaxID=931531 RepID=UPI002664F5F4|nr:gliding motility protein GldN [Tunicatimonas pelagia]WKN41821.1 gliding motility protein GldN [Tunicatimonas pelagia]
MKSINQIVKQLTGAAIIALSTMGVSYGQANDGYNEEGYNDNSIRPIHTSDQLYRTRVWRRMDLKEKQNKPFFSENRWMTRVIVESVMNGTLYPYTNDSVTTRMSKEQFIENMTIPMDGPALSEEEIAMGFGQDNSADDGWGDSGDDGWGDDSSNDDGWGDSAGQGAEGTDMGGAEAAAPQAESYLFAPKDVSVVEIVEDVIFDKERGRQYYDVQAVTLILPPENFPNTGLLKEVASFRYKDLLRVFEENPEIAVWVNPRNSAKNLNLQYAFDLRLFNAHIVKYSNPDDERIVDMTEGNKRQALLKSLEYEYDMLEREHELWEY